MTTIQISDGLREELARLKMYDKESYEEVIWDLIEDSRELSKEALKDLKRAEEDVRKGRLKTLEQIKDELGL